MKSTDIFENKKSIEMLKSNILKNISALYENMAVGSNGKTMEFEDIFSDILINVYVLSIKLDVNTEKTERKAIDKMRLKLLENNGSLNESYAKLCTHFKRRI